MDLKQFVRESIQQVVEGVLAAQSQFNQRTDGLRIGTQPGLHPSDRTESFLRFDIAVTIDENRTNSAGVGLSGGIQVMGVKLAGADAQSKTQAAIGNSTVSRISFEIPLVWPTHPTAERGDSGFVSEPE